jgi:ribosomal protein L7/L12
MTVITEGLARSWSQRSAEGARRYTVVLAETGSDRVRVIHEIRAIHGFLKSTRLDIRATKTLVDSAPCIVVRGASSYEAALLQVRLASVGATVEVGRDREHRYDPGRGHVMTCGGGAGCRPAEP